ncbi:hypothetical protein E2C01_003120 [Portunus trituberculatus]|uniref:Uncharacterized protein n=1 Tax=Portunus trituberculatus TaxID=210409 RepID=A0A5B7CSN4_PORTR|nr:hypothetical protein [Portunus trituberculatus]
MCCPCVSLHRVSPQQPLVKPTAWRPVAWPFTPALPVSMGGRLPYAHCFLQSLPSSRPCVPFIARVQGLPRTPMVTAASRAAVASEAYVFAGFLIGSVAFDVTRLSSNARVQRLSVQSTLSRARCMERKPISAYGKPSCMGVALPQGGWGRDEKCYALTPPSTPTDIVYIPGTARGSTFAITRAERVKRFRTQPFTPPPTHASHCPSPEPRVPSRACEYLVTVLGRMGRSGGASPIFPSCPTPAGSRKWRGEHGGSRLMYGGITLSHVRHRHQF